MTSFSAVRIQVVLPGSRLQTTAVKACTNVILVGTLQLPQITVMAAMSQFSQKVE
jgi:hypothetical protein